MRLSFPQASALLAAALSLTSHAAQAQQTLSDTRPPTVATVRGGAYFPFNARTKDSVGKTWYGGGIDYAFTQKPGISRTVVSVDYIERASGGNTVRLIPLTIGQFAVQGSSNGGGGGSIHPYFGVGVGAYFVHQTIPNDIGISETNNVTTIGGFLAAGLDLSDNLMVEARYHILPKVGAGNSSGLQLMAGFRF